jgi:hypothetical protein
MGVVGALGLLGATAASWIDQPVARAIGDVAVADIRATPGFELTPLAAVAALAALVCDVALLITRGPARRILALLAVGVGVCAVVVVGVGIGRLAGVDGTPTLAPWLAAAASAGMVAAGLLGIRRPARRLPARYEVDAPPGDAEWEIASEPDEPRRELP